jgi:hypothetical protein
MKPITLHPLSVLAGLALAVLAFFATGAAQRTGALQAIPTQPVRVVGQIPAENWVFFELTTKWSNGVVTRQDVYNVPADRFLVLTAGGSGNVLVNGLDVGLTYAFSGLSDEETRVVFAPGSAISLRYLSDYATCNCSGSNTGHFWGYFESAN